jgi:hypothetical protein
MKKDLFSSFWVKLWLRARCLQAQSHRTDRVFFFSLFSHNGADVLLLVIGSAWVRFATAC